MNPVTTKPLDSNPDPITGAPGSHPVGTGLGAAGGGAAGAAIGAVGGPIGVAVGAAIGAVVGGLAGKGVAESVDPTAEDAYWRDNYKHESYYDGTSTYDDYAPAYRLGYGTYANHGGGRFEDFESNMQETWMQARGKSHLAWEHARNAARAGWDRVTHARPAASH